MGIFHKVNIKETFVGVKKLLETCVEKIKDLSKKIMGVIRLVFDAFKGGVLGPILSHQKTNV